MRRSRLATRPRPSSNDPDLSAAWHRAVTYRAVCLACGGRDRIQGHHVLSQQAIRRYASEWGLDPQPLLWAPENGIALCEPCHSGHTARSKPLSRALLPQEAVLFAVTLDSRYGDERQPMLERLKREYPW